MSSFLFINGRIRALETKLLDLNRLDRMVGAKNPEDAFRVLVELQYADYMDEGTKPQDFSSIIVKGLQETKEMILEGTGNHPGFQIFWRFFDLNNLKRGLKIKYLEKKDELGEFTEENGFSRLGNFSEEAISGIIFDQKFPDSFPKEFLDALGEAESVLEGEDGEGEFEKVELLLDRACFAVLQKITSKSSFLRGIFEFLADSANTKALMRSVLVREEALGEDAFLPFGTLEWDRVEKVENFDQFLDFLEGTRFSVDRFALSDKDTPQEKMLKIEKGIDSEYHRFLQTAQEGEIASIQVPFAYFERRLQNAKMIKFIMFAKFHGLDSERIYATLKQF